MYWGRRKTARWLVAELEGPLNTLLNDGNERAQSALQRNRAWGVDVADAYRYDQDEGRLTFTSPGRVIQAPFQFIGTHNARSGTWMWAWANDSISPHLKVDSLALREESRARNWQALTRSVLEVCRDDADCLALLGLATSRYDGFYKAPDGPSTVYLSYGSPLA